MGAISVSIWVLLLILLIDVAVVAGLTYMITRSMFNRFTQEQTTKADNIIAVAKESARVVELEAKDKALRKMQEAETDITRRRQEVSREEERLNKRRSDLDARMEKLEVRE